MFGNITYIPSVAIGMMSGRNYTAEYKEGEEWWENGHQEKYKIQGFGGSIQNRIELNSRSERVGLFYENKISLYHQKHGFLDVVPKSITNN